MDGFLLFCLALGFAVGTVGTHLFLEWMDRKRMREWDEQFGREARRRNGEEPPPGEMFKGFGY